MRMNLRVSYLDESAVDVTASAADFVALEEKYSRSVAKLETDMRLTDICYLAWHALQRTKRTGLTFEEWVENLDTVGVNQDETAEIVPLETSPTTGGSPS